MYEKALYSSSLAVTSCIVQDGIQQQKREREKETNDGSLLACARPTGIYMYGR
jgi:hypothetical protein